MRSIFLLRAFVPEPALSLSKCGKPLFAAKLRKKLIIVIYKELKTFL
jgi:hypothetical protein